VGNAGYGDEIYENVKLEASLKMYERAIKDWERN